MSRPEKHRLSGDLVYRFVRVERFAHWVNALAFLALFISGTLLLLRGRLALSHDVIRELHRAHVGLGAVFFFGPALVFCVGGLRFGLSWLLEAVRWSFPDLLWLLGPLRRILLPRASAPAVGRFNAGQRLNMLLQLVGKWTLAITGLMMHLRAGQLLMYSMHLLFYFILCLLALGHIYMGLIHPPTRHSLQAMISGFVHSEWLAHHHPAWFRHLSTREAEPEPTSAPSVNSDPPDAPPTMDSPEDQA
jgi:formate dehydrogenase subunit gamma